MNARTLATPAMALALVVGLGFEGAARADDKPSEGKKQKGFNQILDPDASYGDIPLVGGAPATDKTPVGSPTHQPPPKGFFDAPLGDNPVTNQVKDIVKDAAKDKVKDALEKKLGLDAPPINLTDKVDFKNMTPAKAIAYLKLMKAAFDKGQKIGQAIGKVKVGDGVTIQDGLNGNLNDWDSFVKSYGKDNLRHLFGWSKEEWDALELPWDDINNLYVEDLVKLWNGEDTGVEALLPEEAQAVIKLGFQAAKLGWNIGKEIGKVEVLPDGTSVQDLFDRGVTDAWKSAEQGIANAKGRLAKAQEGAQALKEGFDEARKNGSYSSGEKFVDSMVEGGKALGALFGFGEW